MTDSSLRFLFYKRAFAWPFQSGHDVHTFHMMRALRDAGHRVGLVTTTRPVQPMLDALQPEMSVAFEGGVPSSSSTGPVTLRRFEERFRSYWGVPEAYVKGLRDVARDFQADAVVVSGLEVLPLTAGIENGVRIWYAADEWVLHHLSLVRVTDRRTWEHARGALVKGLYERSFRSRLDRAWAVSDADRRALRWIAGVPNVDVLPNGVDTDHYAPQPIEEAPNTAVFWGRLDFEPNVQALEWFCTKVWPLVLRVRPEARFTIIGFKLTPDVAALGALPNVTIKPDLPDVRPEVARNGIAVLPFVSGLGIKNKLLEAAALGKPVVCTPRTLGGLRGTAPFLTSANAEEWPGQLVRLWDDPAGRARLGAQGREWVMREHTWAAAARTAVAGVEASLRVRRAA